MRKLDGSPETAAAGKRYQVSERCSRLINRSSLPTEQSIFSVQGTIFQVPLKPYERIQRRERVGADTNSRTSAGI